MAVRSRTPEGAVLFDADGVQWQTAAAGAQRVRTPDSEVRVDDGKPAQRDELQVRSSLVGRQPAGRRGTGAEANNDLVM